MYKPRGFTLIELMIALAIVGIIAAIAYPSFTEAVHKSHRSEAIQTLSDLTLKQERYRSNNATYATCDNAVSPSTCAALNTSLSYYTVAVSGNTGTAYTLTATPKGAQAGDRCGTYTFSMLNGALSKTAAQSNCL